MILWTHLKRYIIVYKYLFLFYKTYMHSVYVTKLFYEKEVNIIGK